jgi:hypothetical protein
MIKYRQYIRPGQSGRDVKAVKRAIEVMHVHNSENLKNNLFAGSQFVKCVRRVQRNHNLHEDGIYGKATHAIIAPHFDTYGRLLYREARLRKPKYPPLPEGNAVELAHELLHYHSVGKYRTDNSGDLYDIQRTAQGLPVWSPLGYWVHLNKQPLELLVWLIKQDLVIGTFALCSDHHTLDGPHGHNGGFAVDIDSINGIAIASQSAKARDLTLRVTRLIRYHTPAALRPWQLICNGYGNMYYQPIAACTIGSYNYYTLRAHRGHIHAGYH